MGVNPDKLSRLIGATGENGCNSLDWKVLEVEEMGKEGSELSPLKSK